MPLNPVALLLLSGLCSAPSLAMELRWTQGLRLAWEALPGETDFNGVSFRVQRVTGLDVPQLVQRIAADWQRESGNDGLQFMQHGDWSILSRIHDGRSEVAQWRERSNAAELLWSEADLRLQPRPAAAPHYLPSACKWMLPVSGSASGAKFRQFTGYCALRAAAVGDALESVLEHEGWRTRRQPPGLTAERRGSRIEVVISPDRPPMGRGDTAEGAAVVVLETYTSGVRPPW